MVNVLLVWPPPEERFNGWEQNAAERDACVYGLLVDP